MARETAFLSSESHRADEAFVDGSNLVPNHDHLGERAVGIRQIGGFRSKPLCEGLGIIRLVFVSLGRDGRHLIYEQ